MTDQNATTHTYLHDVLGRLTADAVTTLGSGVNGSVRLHAYSFTPLGEPYLSSSYSGTTPSPTPTNQVEDVYNGLGQLTQEYQSHAGAVITTPTPTATASVTYAYSGLGSSSQNYSRLSSVTYPDGEVIGYGYNNSTLDNAISRVDFLSEGGSHILDDTYLGLGTVASAAYEDGVTLSYFTSGSSASDSGDEYTNLDRFDRIIEQKYATTTPTPTTTDDFTYGYDADGDVLYQNVPIATSFGQLYHANSTTSGDNATAYDPLNRETAFRRGVLSASGDNGSSLDTVTTASVSDTYSLDALGNQAAVNSQNELTGSLLAYNNDGDQTENPAGGGYCTCDTYDAWNELVSYSSPSPSGTTCETMGYDALGREILDSYSLTSGVSGGDGKYYSADGQVVQDNCSCSCGCGCSFSSATTTDNFVWAPDYVNDLVLRDRTISGTTTRLYAQHDANFDVTALVNTSGTVTERLAYDPYGNVTVLTGAWGGSSDNTWQVRFQGMWLDNTTGLYKTLNRDYSSTEARWIEADPTGHVDGGSLYAAELSQPADMTDPLGLAGFNPYKFLADQILEPAPDKGAGRYRHRGWFDDLYNEATKKLPSSQNLNRLDCTGLENLLTQLRVARLFRHIALEAFNAVGDRELYAEHRTPIDELDPIIDEVRLLIEQKCKGFKPDPNAPCPKNPQLDAMAGLTAQLQKPSRNLSPAEAGAVNSALQSGTVTQNQYVESLEGAGAPSDSAFVGITALGAGAFMNAIGSAVGTAVADLGVGGGTGAADATIDGAAVQLKPLVPTPSPAPVK